MPEIIPNVDAISIDLTSDGNLEIGQVDLSGENSSLVLVPAALIPFFIKKLKEIVREGSCE